jgi:hypothetical protein
VERYWVERAEPNSLLLLSARPSWDGPREVEVSGMTVTVTKAVSTLELRDVLTAADGGRLVVLTELTEADLGADLLSRAVRNRVIGVDLWDTVRMVFGLRSDAVLDGSLVRDGEVVARALVDRAPRAGWTPPPSGVLTRDHAYRALVRELLHLDPARLDTAGLLDWSRDHRGVLALHDTDAPLRTALSSWLLLRAGAGARPVLDLAVKGEGADAVPLGLVAGLLWAPGSTSRAQGWVEQRLGRPVPPAEAQVWDETAAAWVERRLEADHGEAVVVLARAEHLLDEMHASDVAAASRLLPRGLVNRSQALARSLGAWAKAPSAALVGEVETRLRELRRHLLAEPEAGDVLALEMGVRLVRWLAEGQVVNRTALESLTWHVGVGGWVDRARQVVVNGASDPVVGEHLKAVHAAASRARADIDRAAAEQVTIAVREDQSFGEVVPVEHALARLVHVAESTPALLVVLDGMSAAVATEVAESVARLGWVEQADESFGHRTGVMAAFPTVTTVSRTSLLTGSLAVGGQREELQGFTAVCGRSSRLFHQRDLVSDRGGDLSAAVREAIQDGAVPVVGCVLNAVDDSLAGGDPARTRWTVDAVRHLRPLLERAWVAGRVVVLTSDHGHVVDQLVDGELRSAPGGGARWRPRQGSDVQEPRADEVRLTGRRVLLGEGDVVAAVDERLRYRARKEGYHGGAALAEMAIPWVVLAPRGAHVQGHVAVGAQQPPWWDTAASVEESLQREAPSDGSTLF